jgi:hypothetical protein
MMRKTAFYDRARTGRKLARIALLSGDGWAFYQALEYARSGHVGPDFGAWLDWYYGRRDDIPGISYGAQIEADRVMARRMGVA